jgi:hypothetical protein
MKLPEPDTYILPTLAKHGSARTRTFGSPGDHSIENNALRASDTGENLDAAGDTEAETDARSSSTGN